MSTNVITSGGAETNVNSINNNQTQVKGLRSSIKQSEKGAPGTEKLKKNQRKLNSGVPQKILIGRSGQNVVPAQDQKTFYGNFRKSDDQFMQQQKGSSQTNLGPGSRNANPLGYIPNQQPNTFNQFGVGSKVLGGATFDSGSLDRNT